MGFGREAARVRDPALPLGHRFGALRACISHSPPIGYKATWAFLEVRAGIDRRSPGFLLPALELLEAERTRSLAAMAAYCDLRRLQKSAGWRIPPREHTTPQTPRRWWGDELAGARVSLELMRALPPDPPHTDVGERWALVNRCATDVLASDEVSVDLAALDGALTWARRQIHVVGWEADQLAYRAAAQILQTLGQLHLILRGPQPLGTPWRFVD